MFKFFKNCTCIEDVKKTYRDLCKQYHPDLHGAATEEIMKAVNAEYEKAFDRFKNIHRSADSTEDAPKTYTTHDSAEAPEEFRKIIEMLIICDGLEISVVGRWLWAEGNTYPYRETLKKCGFRFASKKKAWYWHKDEDGAQHHSKMTLDDIKNKYGCETFTTRSAAMLAAH